jgi:hypothetical protein
VVLSGGAGGGGATSRTRNWTDETPPTRKVSRGNIGKKTSLDWHDQQQQQHHHHQHQHQQHQQHQQHASQGNMGASGGGSRRDLATSGTFAHGPTTLDAAPNATLSGFSTSSSLFSAQLQQQQQQYQQQQQQQRYVQASIDNPSKKRKGPSGGASQVGGSGAAWNPFFDDLGSDEYHSPSPKDTSSPEAKDRAHDDEHIPSGGFSALSLDYDESSPRTTDYASSSAPRAVPRKNLNFDLPPSTAAMMMPMTASGSVYGPELGTSFGSSSSSSYGSFTGGPSFGTPSSTSSFAASTPSFGAATSSSSTSMVFGSSPLMASNAFRMPLYGMSPSDSYAYQHQQQHHQQQQQQQQQQHHQQQQQQQQQHHQQGRK